MRIIKNVYLKSINFDLQVQNCGAARSCSRALLQITTRTLAFKWTGGDAKGRWEMGIEENKDDKGWQRDNG